MKIASYMFSFKITGININSILVSDVFNVMTNMHFVVAIGSNETFQL